MNGKYEWDDSKQKWKLKFYESDTKKKQREEREKRLYLILVVITVITVFAILVILPKIN